MTVQFDSLHLYTLAKMFSTPCIYYKMTLVIEVFSGFAKYSENFAPTNEKTFFCTKKQQNHEKGQVKKIGCTLILLIDR